MMEFEFLGLTMGQLMTLAAVGVALLVILWLLKAALKLTRTLLRIGCLVIVMVFVVAFFLMRG
jgi:hypothetical protein